jgi:hypothetical protein
VIVKGFVDKVVILAGSEEIARHPTSCANAARDFTHDPITCALATSALNPPDSLHQG